MLFYRDFPVDEFSRVILKTENPLIHKFCRTSNSKIYILRCCIKMKYTPSPLRETRLGINNLAFILMVMNIIKM